MILTSAAMMMLMTDAVGRMYTAYYTAYLLSKVTVTLEAFGTVTEICGRCR